MAAPSISKAIGRMAVVKGDAMMIAINITHWLRARQPRLGRDLAPELPQNPVGARAECRRPTRLLSVVVGSAVILGSLTLTGAWDRASAWDPGGGGTSVGTGDR